MPPEPTPYSIPWVFRDYLLDHRTSDPLIIWVVELLQRPDPPLVEVRSIVRHALPKRAELTGLVLYFIEFALTDHRLVPEEIESVARLKTALCVEEGDFWEHHRERVAGIVGMETDHILWDGNIDDVEALHEVEVQRMFNLGYDQYLALTDRAVLERANQVNAHSVRKLVDLHEWLWSKGTKLPAGRVITNEVREIVWSRDGGRCVVCGATKDLQFDHIVPFARGGSSSADNVQLLCGECNRRKSDNLTVPEDPA